MTQYSDFAEPLGASTTAAQRRMQIAMVSGIPENICKNKPRSPCLSRHLDYMVCKDRELVRVMEILKRASHKLLIKWKESLQTCRVLSLTSPEPH